jgi:hypothetical protein
MGCSWECGLVYSTFSFSTVGVGPALREYDILHSFVLGIHPRVLDSATWCVAGTPGSGVSSGTTAASGMLFFEQAQLVSNSGICLPGLKVTVHAE